MTLSEHIQRITSHRHRVSDRNYHVTLVVYHDSIRDWMHNRQHSNSGVDYLPEMFERFVGFFAGMPDAVNIEEALKLGTLSAQELERIQDPGFDLFHLSATLHMHVSEAYDGYVWLQGPCEISPAGPYEEDGYFGVPISFARAVTTIIAFAETRHIALSARVDEALKRRSPELKTPAL